MKLIDGSLLVCHEYLRSCTRWLRVHDLAFGVSREESILTATLCFTKPPCGHDIVQDLHCLWPWQQGMASSCGHVMLRKSGHNMGKITHRIKFLRYYLKACPSR